MRDLALILIFPYILVGIFKRPFIGIGLWIWTAMFFPNAWVYSFASVIRYNYFISLATIISYTIKPKQKFKPDTLLFILFIFLFWTTLSSIFTIGEPDTVMEFWLRFLKIVTFYFFAVAILEKKLHIDFVIWSLILSIGGYGSLEGTKYILSGAGHTIEGFAEHALGDRNELALAFVMMLPLIIYMAGQVRKSSIIWFGLIGMLFILIIAVLGTFSRGGFIGLSCVGGYFFLKSNKKLLMLSLLPIPIVAASFLLPETWFARMNTIETAGTEDSSFLGRVIAWKLSLLQAIDHPFLGGGFKSITKPDNWFRYSDEFYKLDFIPTPDPDPKTPHAAHSIYFQILGEHGFVGLFLFLTILFLGFRNASYVIRSASKNNCAAWIINLAKMIQVSMVAYCVSGAALSFAYFDGYYVLLSILYSLRYRILPAEYNKQSDEPKQTKKQKKQRQLIKRAININRN